MGSTPPHSIIIRCTNLRDRSQVRGRTSQLTVPGKECSSGAESLLPLFLLPPRGSSSHCDAFLKHLRGCGLTVRKDSTHPSDVQFIGLSGENSEGFGSFVLEIREQHHFNESTSAELDFDISLWRDKDQAAFLCPPEPVFRMLVLLAPCL